ncbi:MAG TPA: hypothetical protein VHW65_09535 [Gemmatimonadales bacterium]|nr:hypothetical protein [Gemmatimonadales bacterium]
MRLQGILLIALVACGHSEPFTGTAAETHGPSSAGTPVQFTFNPAADYAPALTQDGRGILYAYAQPGRGDDDRCVGMLPAAGGTQLWSMCDNEIGQQDSTNGFSAYAAGDDGRLLYFEATSPAGLFGTPVTRTLWLADTATPFVRRALARFPVTVGSTSIEWLTDVEWTGPTSFVAIGSVLEARFVCKACVAADTFFAGANVIAGAITSTGVGLVAVPGTENASVYAIAEQGASVIFATNGSLNIQRVALAGGAATTIAALTSGDAVTGLSCLGTTCVATTDVVPSLTDIAKNAANEGTLWLVDLAGHTARLLSQPADGAGWFAPRLTGSAGDVILQVRGSPSLLSMDNLSGGDLYLFKGIAH